MPQVTYETCDVFATTKFKFGGNPLAVFFLENADQLTSEQMQLLAREVGCKYLCDDCDVTLLRMLTPCRLRNDLRYASRVQRTHRATARRSAAHPPAGSSNFCSALASTNARWPSMSIRIGAARTAN